MKKDIKLEDFPPSEFGSDLHILLVAYGVGHFNGLTHQNIPSGCGQVVQRLKKEALLEYFPSSDKIGITKKGIEFLISLKKK